MDVGGWLRSLGLGQYEAAFRENEIDDEVLPNLTAEDLRELGVAILGHRRKMLAAIAELSRSSAPAALASTPPPVVSGEKTAERRQLTVMFCDLVGSTALSARLDPEDMREIIGAYHRCCTEQFAMAGGFVAKYMGDGVLAYFGYPQAHEHDAERGVRAGLGAGRGGAQAQDHRRCSLAGARRHCHRARGGRRPHRLGRGAGAGGRRRHAESGGAAAGDRRAEYGRHRRQHATTSRQSLRAEGARAQGPQGHRRAGAGVGCAAGEFRGEPL